MNLSFLDGLFFSFSLLPLSLIYQYFWLHFWWPMVGKVLFEAKWLKVTLDCGYEDVVVGLVIIREKEVIWSNLYFLSPVKC